MKNILAVVSFLTLALASLLLGQATYPYYINTAAGSYPLGDGGPAIAAMLESPRAVAMDGKGNLYIGDNSNSLIRKVTAGVITTVPGGNSVSTWAIALDAAGNLYFTDGTYRVSRLTPTGALTVVAGTTTQGFAGDEGRATSALLRNPYGLVVDNAGVIYIADAGNNRVRKITTDGIIHTVAGTGAAGYNGDGIPATSATLNPRSLALDAAGNLYIADYSSNRIRKMTPSGLLSTVAGTGANASSGDGGPATSAAISLPAGLALDSAGNLYVSTAGRIRRISPDGVIRAFAGTGTVGYSGDGGAATAAQMDPMNMAADSAGNLYVADNSNCRVRMIKPDGTIATVAGASHFAGDGGAAASAMLHFPYDVAFDGAGNMYIADSANNRVRKVDSSGIISTYAGTGNAAFNSSSGPATQVNLSSPRGLAWDASGNLYIADSACRVRRVSPDGNTTAVAGTGVCSDGADGGPAALSPVDPYALAVDAAGNLYISDSFHNRVRKVSPDGTISAFAGSGTAGSGADGVRATQSALNTPYNLAVDKAGNVYIADSANHRVRMVNPAGIVTTVAGNGSSSAFPLNDGKLATTVGVYYPTGVAIDGQGNLYITQPNISYIRKVDPSGIITTIAGNNAWSFAGDSGPGMSASVNYPRGITADANGNLYFADSANHRIRSLVLNSPVKLDIASGDNQSAPFGQYLSKALAVKLAGRAAGVPGVKIGFAVTSGSATLGAATAYTDASGVATITAKLGNTAGKVSVVATTGGLPPAMFTLTAVDPNVMVPGGPSITAGGVVGAGLSSPSVKDISANGIVSIYGSNFAAAGAGRVVTSADLVNGRLPARFAGICVQAGAAMAPILAVYPNQINVQIPYSPLSANVYVQVILNCGASGEVRSNMQSVTVRYATPEFLSFAPRLDGKNPIAATDAVTGALIGAPGLLPGATLRPAKPGDVLTLYGTGFGATSPPTDAGVFPTRIANTVLPPKVTIGMFVLAATDILYAGVSPYNPGLYQLNIRIPSTVPDGDQPVSLGLGLYATPREDS